LLNFEHQLRMTDFEIMRPEKDISDAGYELGDGVHE
jgi:hypothetical protein